MLIGFLLGVSVAPAQAQFDTLETEDLRLLFSKAKHSYLVPHVARCFQNSLDFHKELWEYSPSERVTVLLADFSDSGNASAGAVPTNHLLFQMAPLSFAYETLSGNERMNWMMNHELVHVAVVDRAAASDRRFRKLFGGKVMPIADHPESIFYFYLTTPRAAAPGWYQEGIAVFLETWMAGGVGRAQGAYDEMVFRSKVRDDSRFYDPLGLVSEGTQIDFQVGVNNYLYGTRFMTYLAHTTSPEDLVAWVSRRSGSKRYYSAQFKEVFGKSLEEAWSEWIIWEQDFQNQNLARIRRYPTTPFRDLSDRALGSVSRAFYDADRQKLYAAFRYPGVVAHIGAFSMKDGSVEKIIDVKDPVIFTVTSMAYDPENKKIFYTTDNHKHRDLRSVDPETKETELLIRDARVGDLAFNQADRSIWGIRHFNGIATLVRIPFPYREWEQIHSFPYGEIIYNLDISPDGSLLSASKAEINGDHRLLVMETNDLIAGEVAPIGEVDFAGSIPSNFVFSSDSKYLYGSSYYTGASNIFRYEIGTKSLVGLTNTETGFFRPIPVDEDTLIVFRYTGEGFVPATVKVKPVEDINPIVFLGQQLVEANPILKDWKLGSPADVPLESLITEEGTYSHIREIQLESVYPVVEGYKDFEAIGFTANFSDPLRLNRASFTASYTSDSALPSDERLHLNLEYQRYDWSFSGKYNDADFYDLFGPTKKSRKGYSFGIGYHKSLIFDRPRNVTLDVEATYYGGLDRLPNFQNVVAPVEEILNLEAALSYSNLRKSLGAVDDEKGFSWDLVGVVDQVSGETIPRILGNLDVGFALPLRHSSIWLRTSAGGVSGDREDPNANYFFGGFGNNYVGRGEIKRYREWYSFPGVELNAIGGKSFAKAMVEWNLPPIRFRGLGTPGFYGTWLRPALFAAGLSTDFDSSADEREVGSVGAQLDLRFKLLSRLEMTLSAGYAVAFESGRDSADEFMLSLKVL